MIVASLIGFNKKSSLAKNDAIVERTMRAYTHFRKERIFSIESVKFLQRAFAIDAKDSDEERARHDDSDLAATLNEFLSCSTPALVSNEAETCSQLQQHLTIK